MANEAVTVELLGDGGNVVDFTVPDATGVSGGCIMLLSGAAARTAVKSGDGAAQRFGSFAGIAASEKEADDGQTNLGLYTKGIFDLTCVAKGHNIKLGSLVVVSGANMIRAAVANELTGACVGKALEAGSNSTPIEVAVGVY